MGILRPKLFWLSFWVIGFAVFMTGMLLYFKYQSVITGLQRDRVWMVAQEITEIAQKSLSLGQDFREMARLQDVIERRHEADTIVLAIEVTTPDARLVYATDLAQIGTALNPIWFEQFARSPKLISLDASADQAVVASRIRNSFDQLAGYVVIRYSRHNEQVAMRSFQHRLWLCCGGAFALFTLLLYATLAGFWRHIEAGLAGAAMALEDPSGAETQSAAMSPALKREIEAINAQLAAAAIQLKLTQTGLAP